MQDSQKKIIGAIVGAMIALLMLLIGFFRTLLVVLMAALGWFLASHKRTIMRELTWAWRHIRRS